MRRWYLLWVCGALACGGGGAGHAEASEAGPGVADLDGTSEAVDVSDTSAASGDSAAGAVPDVEPSPDRALRDRLGEGAVSFVDVSDALEDNASARRYGVAVTDVDGDGDFEAVVAGYSGANEVWGWDGARLVNVTPEPLRDPDRQAIGVAACDLDGDGLEEIYFLNIDRFGGQGAVADRLWMRDDAAEGGWRDLFEADENAGQINTFSGRSVACLDRDGDGRYGVFVANYGGPMKLFELNADGRLVDVAEEAGVALTTGGRALLAIPLDDDADMDLFAGNERGPNFLFRNNGDGTFDEIAADAGVADAQETVRGTAVLDADGDGDFDLVYGNWEGAHRLWLREPGDTVSFVDAAPDAMARPGMIRTVIAADFDDDGREEIFWNAIGEPNRLFAREGDAWEPSPIGDALESSGLGTGAAVWDADGDGRLELMVSHGESGAQPLSLYVSAPSEGSHTLRVLPRTQAGAPARGAEVVVTFEDGTTARRVVDAGSGYLCQMEPVAHFGVPAGMTPVDIRVLWPDGMSRTVPAARLDDGAVLEVTR